MARSFTKREKEMIKSGLLEACQQSWTRFGYKKTSVEELCRQAGISKGAFYLFFESKEALFCDVLCTVQARIYDLALQTMEEQKNKHGAARALKLIYREYEKNRFLYASDSGDFTVFLNRLNKEQAEKIQASNRRNRELFSCRPYLKFKIEEDLALSIIYTLIMNLRNQELLPDSHREAFDFMVDHLMDGLYE